MWHWDQGRLEYFQFSALRSIAAFAVRYDFKSATREMLATATGLPFSAPATHSPWRNYSRILKLCLLISESQGHAQPTPVALLLSQPGAITSDEYFHFLAQCTTEPSPALQDWSPNANFRYPLLFALKYLLTKAQAPNSASASLDEVIGAYRMCGFVGNESEVDFLSLLPRSATHVSNGRSAPESLRRQARESLKILCQISYLHLASDQVYINLPPKSASKAFAELAPIGGPRAPDRDAEIMRLANLLGWGTSFDFLDQPDATAASIVESGFAEGSKVERTHITIERNAGLRKSFFASNPTSVCDVCDVDTAKTYPWTDRVMDIHHLLPLSSGTRVLAKGTTHEDLVPLCPSCHRAVHRFYGAWFQKNKRKDFNSKDEAVGVYEMMKSNFSGIIHA